MIYKSLFFGEGRLNLSRPRNTEDHDHSAPPQDPSQILPLSREEILGIYDRGPEAVIDLVESLYAIIILQEKRIAELEERVRSLERQLNKNSRNSSKPPSTDRISKPKSLRGKSDRPAGGQLGHAGHTLHRVDDPDHTILHQVHVCSTCGTSLENVPPTDWERRQVFDLPPQKIEVTEHQAEMKICPGCGRLNEATFPEDVRQPTQYGSRLKASAVYLSQYQLIPYDRLSELFADIFGHNLSQATLVNANLSCYEILEPVEDEIKKQLIDSHVIHLDETGMRIKGIREWLHVISTEYLTYYAAHHSRGSEANETMGILPVFEGRCVHDGWKPYFKFGCLHALCNAHHLRELTGVAEEDCQEWPGEMIDLLLEIKRTAEERRSIDSWLDPDEVERFEVRYDQIIKKGMLENPPPKTPDLSKKRGRKKQTAAKNLVDRLSEYHREVLAFMYDPKVPFDNNLAERDIRMVKVQQKVSGTFRSKRGADSFCRIRGYISTARKNSVAVLDAIQGAFEGKPYVPPSAAT
jgi:transposase